MAEQAFSYWEHQQFLQGFDVAVVGAGIVGLTAAIFTKRLRPQARVCVLERDILPNGASTKNAGFACFGSISELLEQEKKGGTAALLNVVRARWEGLALLRELLGDEALLYEDAGSYELFRPEEAALAHTCQAHIGYFNDLLAPIIGRPDVFRDATANISRFGLGQVTTMLENQAEGALDTGRLMHALLKLAWQHDIVVLHSCPVLAIEEAGPTMRLRTPSATIEAGQVLLATNAFSRQFFPALDVQPGRGQVLVTEPIAGLRLLGTFHYDKGYYYFRQVDGRILLGGGRNLDFATEATTEPGLTDLVQQKLEQLLYEVILPGQRPRIDYRWSGVMAFGADLAPIIQPLAPGIFGALRCNGMGVAMGAGVGRRAAEMLEA
ncbi:Glycine/D-amino acid oxidase [Hymenobacter daecheongensis DSM 21074]|uniref:Glycine/D-amino acid oxidase n=1 Tax=Hymenobacter daecheongensis DSM 21074 TaxID=1121955 RepID=A0A1M6B232_9BACT|nr:FAD-dependent oxidoreductase [Hymenobacter daecheongensis]SHI42792.1 Glycine/D-amino acid oxidase [Hymenobacter daecheongensis DSM 21074]